MAADIILISRFPIAPGTEISLRGLLVDDFKTRYLIDMNQQEILQLRAYKDLEDFAIHANELDNDWDKFSEFMIDDVHRELLQYVEGPKPSESLLPETDYIQLRHIDVPPKLIQKYRRNVNRP